MNAFNTGLGFLGNAADAVLLGGAVGKARRRNQFADYLGQGKFGEAEALAVRHGEGDYAKLAQQRALSSQSDQDAENKLFSGLAFALASIEDPAIRERAFETMKPGLARYGFSQEDYAQVPIGDVNALRAFGQSFIAPETQAAQALDARQLDEAVRSNKATEGLRGGELGIARDRLNLDRDKFRAESAPAAIGGEAQPPPPAAVNAIEERGQRVATIDEAIDRAIEQVDWSNTGVLFGNSLARNTIQSSRDLDATIDTIRANIGFEELHRLRSIAPNGSSGLGQVTEKEIRFLQSVMGSIEQSQSREQLVANLQRAREQINASWERVKRAYETEFGQAYDGPAPDGQQTAISQSGPQRIGGVDDYNRIAPGTEYIDPSGVLRRKGGG